MWLLIKLTSRWIDSSFNQLQCEAQEHWHRPPSFIDACKNHPPPPAPPTHPFRRSVPVVVRCIDHSQVYLSAWKLAVQKQGQLFVTDLRRGRGAIVRKGCADRSVGWKSQSVSHLHFHFACVLFVIRNSWNMIRLKMTPTKGYIPWWHNPSNL